MMIEELCCEYSSYYYNDSSAILAPKVLSVDQDLEDYSQQATNALGQAAKMPCACIICHSWTIFETDFFTVSIHAMLNKLLA